MPGLLVSIQWVLPNCFKLFHSTTSFFCVDNGHVTFYFTCRKQMTDRRANNTQKTHKSHKTAKNKWCTLHKFINM